MGSTTAAPLRSAARALKTSWPTEPVVVPSAVAISSALSPPSSVRTSASRWASGRTLIFAMTPRTVSLRSMSGGRGTPLMVSSSCSVGRILRRSLTAPLRTIV